eukprot:CAMPEP_0184388966 /NCGR_PEP_ID=MMETSP0007-20130409/12091_1 /TAXON_ID=97485 /ORGANISM="Prymnesium parvum, Strain Texoma1" /LENGTH=132 /DNA_ID=CAMNT_0026738087 /DNA_START=283 /DNA_END=682 /DNA_ORIENTATION=-
MSTHSHVSAAQKNDFSRVGSKRDGYTVPPKQLMRMTHPCLALHELLASSSSSSSSRRSTFICSSFITSVHSVIVILPSASASIRSSHRLKAASSGFFAGSSCSIAWVQATRTGTTRGAYCLGWASRKIRAAG